MQNQSVCQVRAHDMPSGWAIPADLPVSQQVLRASVALVLGAVLPWVCHQFTVLSHPAGVILLPLFLPVALAAFILPWRTALGVAALLPVVSLLSSGMPGFQNLLLPMIVLEGVAMVLVIRFSLRHLSTNPWVAFALGALANRLTAVALTLAVAGTLGHLALRPALMMVALGVLGLILHAAVLPGLLAFFRHPR